MKGNVTRLQMTTNEDGVDCLLSNRWWGLPRLRGMKSKRSETTNDYKLRGRSLKSEFENRARPNRFPYCIVVEGTQERTKIRVVLRSSLCFAMYSVSYSVVSRLYIYIYKRRMGILLLTVLENQ
jgi:hypothetical protein